MKQALIFALSLVSISASQSSNAATFVRTNTEYCIRYYQPKLGADDNDIKRVCASYKDENLDRALRIMSEFNTTDYRGAIRIVMLELNNTSAYSCTMGKMRSGRNGLAIGDIISDCGGGGNRQESVRRVETPTRPHNDWYDETPRQPVQPREVAKPRVEVPYNPQPMPAPQRRSQDSDAYYVEPTGTLIGKIKKADFIREVAKWMNVKPSSISRVETDEYFGLVVGMIEALAQNLGKSERLYKVSFVVNGNEIACTGTDFAPHENGTLRYFTLHECTVNRQFGAMASKFGELNYDFQKNLSDKFREKMKQAEAKWSGDGNITFRKDVSDYLVIGY